MTPKMWIAAGLPGIALLAVLLAPAASAQQGWAPLVTPSDAATQPMLLPRVRPQRPVAIPAPVAEVPVAPLPFAEQRKTLPPALPAPARVETPAFETALARNYCIAIADQAAETKFAWQKKALNDLALEIESRVARLEEKTAEYQKWLARRDEFAKKAQDQLVVIYTRMRPDAAGLQLTAMDEETAAAILIKLDPRIASTILNDMEPKHAARLTGIISGAGKVVPGKAPAANATAVSGDRKS